MEDFFSENIISYLEKILNHNNLNYEQLFEDLKNNFSTNELINCFKYI